MAVAVKAGTRQKKVSKHVMENSVEKVKSYLEDTSNFCYGVLYRLLQLWILSSFSRKMLWLGRGLQNFFLESLVHD